MNDVILEFSEDSEYDFGVFVDSPFDPENKRWMFGFRKDLSFVIFTDIYPTSMDSNLAHTVRNECETATKICKNNRYREFMKGYTETGCEYPSLLSVNPVKINHNGKYTLTWKSSVMDNPTIEKNGKR